ncbi:hypothetical protein BDW22DRAFT_1430945 [Trametopsis cervina]|nr:hypothetical protein BDW22DRAFT_1430945 [Trametopsis cervina]
MTYPDPNYPDRRYAYRERPYGTASQPSQHLPSINVKVEDVDAVPGLSHSQYHQPPLPSYYRFGNNTGPSSISSNSTPTTPVTPFTFMSGAWPGSSSSSHSNSMSGPSFQQQQQQQYPSNRMPNGYVMHSPIDPHPHHSLQSMQDDYDDEDDGQGDLAPGSLNGYASSGVEGTGSGMQGLSKAAEKQIRRRSSKACDQCRKSKCKCERSSQQDSCKNCVLLGTPCTFLGPSRKRGPPKGYIDAIEARLHQTEALVGIMLASKDSRAKSLLEDLSEDKLAKEIIDRVNNSPYGHKGRKRGGAASRPRPNSSEPRDDHAPPAAQSAHPSSEWQDAVTAHLNARAVERKTFLGNGETFGDIASSTKDSPSLSYPQVPNGNSSKERNGRPTLSVNPPSGISGASERTKRVAESSGEDTGPVTRLSDGTVYRPQAFANVGPPNGHGNYSLAMDIPQSDSPTFYQPYSRWTADDNMPAISGGLSTSVLPHQYSTGLVDDRIQRHPDRHNRFPQYWSDYSSLGQMDPTYVMPVIGGEMVSPPPGDAQGEQIYVPDQFTIYNNISHNN